MMVMMMLVMRIRRRRRRLRRRRRRGVGRRLRRLRRLMLSMSTIPTHRLQFFPLFLFELFLRLEVLPQIVFRFGGERGFLRGFVQRVGLHGVMSPHVRLVRMQMLLQFVLPVEALATGLALEPLFRHVDGFNVTLQLVLSGECLRTLDAFKVANVRVSRDFVTL